MLQRRSAALDVDVRPVPARRFADVWGQDGVVERVREDVAAFADSARIEALGGRVPTTILLWGPSGTGKSMLGEAAAGELGAPLVRVRAGLLVDGGRPLDRVHAAVRRVARRHGRAVVVVEEAEALGGRSVHAHAFDSTGAACNGMAWMAPATVALVARASGEQWSEIGAAPAARGRALQAFLDRLRQGNERVLVVLATTSATAVDEAMGRPGRVDRVYRMGYPSKVGRARTLTGYLGRIRHGVTSEDVERFATMTPYATGASIEDMVNEALIAAVRDGREEVTFADLVKAKHLRDLGPAEDVEYVERERHAVAVHEACHAVVAAKLRRHLTIDVATIEKGTGYLGLVASIPPEDQFTWWRSEYEADIQVSLASLAGERLFFDGDNSSGVSGDLVSATFVASYMEGYWGMGSTVASHGVSRELGTGGGRPGERKTPPKAGPELLEGTLGERIERKLVHLLEQTEAILEEHRTAVLAVAHALEAHKTLTGDDIAAVLDGRQGPTVDGRPYHHPSFATMAEAYHRVAVDAHRNHARIDVPLPDLTGFPEDQVVAGVTPRGGRPRGARAASSSDSSRARGRRVRASGSG